MNSQTLTEQWHCRNFPSTHTVSHHSQALADASTPLCGRWFQTQTTAAVRAEALCCRASGSGVCVEAGKCQGLSWWLRSDQIWNVSGCCMYPDVRGAWSQLHKAEWSWWLSKKADFLIKKDSTCQCVLRWCAKEHQGTMQPSGWPEVEKPPSRSSKKAGCFSNVTQLDNYYVTNESITKNSKLQKATRLLTTDLQHYI